MKTLVCLLATWVGMLSLAHAQGLVRQAYHDGQHEHIKEIYQVRDTISNILQGRYISYYLNGNVESKGQFDNNETVGVWEFFFETGNLKMRGILQGSSNYGKWEYFYENGVRAMEGTVEGKNREGEWHIYYENGQLKESGPYKNNVRSGFWQEFYEDGILKGEIDYVDDFGRYTEYYHSHKVYAEGPKSGTKTVGHWRFYAEDGTLTSDGDYENNKKNGLWANYYPSGKVSSRGLYKNDEPDGTWEYFFEDGKVSSSGSFLGGQKHAYWSSYDQEGKLKSEVQYDKGTGEYREYYKNGSLKVKGLIIGEEKEGKWEYFYPDGKPEGNCEFEHGDGIYHGYFPNGALQTKGRISDDKKVGTWELYESDGTLSGYYRPFYNNNKISREINELATSEKPVVARPAHRLGYFDSRFNEFRGLIVEGNPLMMFAGRFPLGMEFYFQERLGHEFEFTGIRDPFFMADDKIPTGKIFQRGYSIAMKQKFYNPVKIGMWYFGHEIRFTNFGHFVNIPPPLSPETIFTIASYEQRIEYGIMLGYRIMQRNNESGFTIDTFVSGDIGYRNFDVDPNYSQYFQSVKQSPFSRSLNIGLKFGNVFSYK